MPRPYSLLEVTVHRRGPETVVAPRGEIDLSTAGDLEAELERAAAGTGPLLLDLTHVNFIDTSGLRVVVSAARAARAGRRRFRVLRGPRRVQRTFELARVTDEIPFAEPRPGEEAAPGPLEPGTRPAQRPQTGQGEAPARE